MVRTSRLICVLDRADKLNLRQINRMCAKSLAALTLISCLLVSAAVSAASLPEKYQFIQEEFPDVEITAIEPSPIPGILQMSVGADLYYVSEDGKYFIAGDIFAMKSKENITELAGQRLVGLTSQNWVTMPE